MAVSNITTSSGRSKLKPRREPYFKQIAVGQSLGYRKLDKGGTWIARSTKHKTRKHSALGTDTEYPEYNDALKAAMTWFATIGTDDAPDAAYTVANCIADYISDIGRRKGKDAALRTQQSANKHILPELGNIPLAKLKTKRLKTWLQSLPVESDDPERVRKSQDTANRVYTILRSALNAAFRDGVIADDAAWRRVEPYREVGRARQVFLSAEDARSLLAACTPELRALVRSSLLTGGRFGELARRKVADLDFAERVLRIPDGKTGARDVVLSDAALAHFKLLARDKLPGAYLHMAADGAAWRKNVMAYWFRAAVKAANEAGAALPEGTCYYSLRHAFISWALLAGVRTQVVAENTGTSVSMIERHYGKFLKRDRIDMLNAVAAV